MHHHAIENIAIGGEKAIKAGRLTVLHLIPDLLASGGGGRLQHREGLRVRTRDFEKLNRIEAIRSLTQYSRRSFHVKLFRLASSIPRI